MTEICAHCGAKIYLDYDQNFQLPDGTCYHAECLYRARGDKPPKETEDDLP